ncbi:hypothetical protein PanWU01x14_132770, partial [Parasponia andersonii]
TIRKDVGLRHGELGVAGHVLEQFGGDCGCCSYFGMRVSIPLFRGLGILIQQIRLGFWFWCTTFD